MKRVMALGSLLIAAFLAGVIAAPQGAAERLASAPGVAMFNGPQLPDLQFTDEHGQPRSLSSLEGRWLLLFFGYTYCPDVCPMTLMHLSRLWKQLTPEQQAQLQVVLVSVDPARDTPESLQPYMQYFNPAFMALTGNDAGLRELSTRLNAFYARVDREGDAAYLMDHSANIVLISPQGQYRGYIEPPHDPARMQPLVEALLSVAPAD